MASFSRKAFTLVEVMIVSFIFATLAAVASADYYRASRIGALTGAANELASRIKQAQTMAYANVSQQLCSSDHYVCKSGSACDSSYPTGCVSQAVSNYGVILDTDSTDNKYFIGADYDMNGTWTSAETIPGGSYVFPAGITFSSIAPSVGANAYNLSYAFSSTNGTPFIPCSSNCVTTITLRDSVSARTKTIVVQKITGLVYVQ